MGSKEGWHEGQPEEIKAGMIVEIDHGNGPCRDLIGDMDIDMGDWEEWVEDVKRWKWAITPEELEKAKA